MPADDGFDREPDPLFESVEPSGGDRIFERRELVTIDHLPTEDRIVGRDEQIRMIAGEIGPAVSGAPPNSVMIYGKTGSGKSLVAKHVVQRSEREATRRGNALATGYANCSQAKGNSDTLQQLGEQITPADSSVTFPERGISENEYFNRLWTVLDEQYDAAVFILDEIDRLKNDDILMILSRAAESGSVSTPIGVIAISNKINYREQMSERTKSSFGHTEYVFDPYDATQLREILANRTDAFKNGTLEDGVIPRAAALGAKEHGDARKAMRLLRYAGDYAKNNGADTVREEHLLEVRASAEAERLRDLVSGLPSHSRHVLNGLAALTKQNEERQWFRTTQIIDAYERVCRKEGVDTLTKDRVRQLLKELAFLEVTENRSNHGGKGTGSYKEHRLMWDAETVSRMHSRS
ncbi:cell division control protein 6 [Halorientalis persicus]|jgi:cell division control protein 6|uniref:ORC1-type DNA replication protein n=1 Tax=Halorientalis persicus TaxID=1367881 RepID=A0A1H8SKE9_9EURY|nr:orc1/cdc6 family replication initiation protein [Halorientalis persicus]SEO78834.1 cell division control protein 6 [Halorientalis persicus]